VSRARRLGELTRAERLSQWRRRTWENSGQGLDPNASPIFRDDRNATFPTDVGGLPPSTVPHRPGVGGPLDPGETVKVRRASMTVGPTPAAVPWDTVDGAHVQFGLDGAPTSLAFGQPCYAQVVLTCDAIAPAQAGLTVTVKVDGRTVDADTAGFASSLGRSVFTTGAIDAGEPVTVEVSASTAGTVLSGLEAAVVLDDRARVEEPECPKPVWWVRGDNLTGYTQNDEVNGWVDRTGGGRHLTPNADDPADPLPRYTADAVDGMPGIWWPNDENSQASLDVAFPSNLIDLSAGRTMVVVGTQGTFVYNAVTMETGLDIMQFIVGASEQYWAGGNNGGWWTYDTLAGPWALVGWIAPGQAGEVRVNGVRPAPPADEYQWPPFGDPPSFELGYIRVRTSYQSATAEVILFDQAFDPAADLVDLDAGCETIGSYLARTYPTLYGGG
jgi:hypothetical protein